MREAAESAKRQSSCLVRSRSLRIRRAIASALGVAVLGIVLIVATVFARQFGLENRRERAALFEARYEQCVECLRLLTQRESSAGVTIESRDISLDSLLPASLNGTARLAASPAIDGTTLIDCTIRLSSETQSLTRETRWALRPARRLNSDN